MSETVELSNESLASRIAKAVEADLVQLPPLPELATRVRDLLAREEDVDIKEVADLIRTDPAVVASLLRVANSATYGGLRQVTELNEAIVRLGLKAVGSTVTALLMKGHFSSGSGKKRLLLQSMWDHAVATAFAAQRLAPHAGADPRQAFLSGLLHDSGMLLVLKSVDYLEGNGLDVPLTRKVYDELMEALHAELGYVTLTTWNLPESICQVARCHENPVVEDGDPLLLCVQAADVIVRKLGFDLKPDPELTLLDEPAIEALGLSDVQLAALMVDLEDELEDARKMLSA